MGVGVNNNLIPCKPGESGNPNGRPKGSRSFSSLIREMSERSLHPDSKLMQWLKENYPTFFGNNEKTNMKTLIVVRLFSMVTNPNDDVALRGIRELINRADGLPIQVIDGDVDNEITIRFEDETPLDEIKKPEEATIIEVEDE